MARLPTIDPATATGTTKQLFDTVQKAMGKTPNMTRVMANSPHLLQAYLQLSATMAGGSIPAKARESIALLSAETNNCVYCLSAHSMSSKLYGLSPADAEAARQGDAVDPTTHAILIFAQALIDTRGGVSEDDVRAARAAGLTDAQLADIVGLVALNALTNTFNRAFQTDIDFPVVQPRHATEPMT